MKIRYGNFLPDKDAFFNLYETTGWNSNRLYSAEELYQAITNSWYVISVYEKERLIGFGRIISDGVYQTFIGDVMVDPDFQNRGIGSEIMRLLVEKCEVSGIKWIQLTSARGKTDFYRKFGFEERPEDGPGMQKYLNT